MVPGWRSISVTLYANRSNSIFGSTCDNSMYTWDKGAGGFREGFLRQLGMPRNTTWAYFGVADGHDRVNDNNTHSQNHNSNLMYVHMCTHKIMTILIFNYIIYNHHDHSDGDDDYDNNGQRYDDQLFHRFFSLQCLLFIVLEDVKSWPTGASDALLVWKRASAGFGELRFRTIQTRGPSLWSEGCKSHWTQNWCRPCSV